MIVNNLLINKYIDVCFFFSVIEDDCIHGTVVRLHRNEPFVHYLLCKRQAYYI